VGRFNLLKVDFKLTLRRKTFPEAGFKLRMVAKIKLDGHRLASGKVTA
jgi:hypothetical protein